MSEIFSDPPLQDAPIMPDDEQLMTELLLDFFKILLMAFYTKREVNRMHPDNKVGLKYEDIFGWKMQAATPSVNCFSKN